jgi:3-mercaptopyruvate sulfurtransferase SseA
MSASVKVQALVGPDWIAARLDDPSVRFVEIDVSPAAYTAGHIPGAVFWERLRRPATG